MSDDTEMTADEFLATRSDGKPARVVTSRAEYDRALSLHPVDPEDAVPGLRGKAPAGSQWNVDVDDLRAVTIGSQHIQSWAVKVSR